jgi:hypothetical protein
MNMKAELKTEFKPEFKTGLKAEYKCPWCGTNFQNGKDLDAHARKHYTSAI